jgi:glycosyltransferase involved in cell wall biosynthesis
MRKNALMLAETRPALVGHLLLQLKDTNPDLFDEVLIYHIGGCSEKDVQIFNSLFPCTLVNYNSPLPEEIFSYPSFARFSKLVTARYEMFRLLEQYDTVVWLDTDLLLQGSIAELIGYAEISGFAILREDPVNKSSLQPDTMRTNFYRDLPGYDMSAYSYCTGIIALSRKLRPQADYTAWCYQKTAAWAENLNLPDQGVINALIQEFKLDAVPINASSYGAFPYYGRDCSQSSCLHSWGANKFWNDWYLYLKYPKWKAYYDHWRELGGSELAGAGFAPAVSVLMPLYKPDIGWLKESLDSLTAQKRNEWERFSDFEILLVCEPFDRKAIEQTVAAYDDPRIRLEFNSQRLGIAASLNQGLRLAKGKYIARLDADDRASELRLFKQKEYLDKTPFIHMCVSDFLYFGEMNESRYIFDGAMSKAWSLLTCPFDHPTIMFRRDFFVGNDLFYDEERRYAEDWELWLRAFKKGMAVGAIHEKLTDHRWHSGSAGQVAQTGEMMDKLAQANFAAMGVVVEDDFAWALRPWNGRLNGEEYTRLQTIFDQALEANRSAQFYDEQSLRRVFGIRLTEARTGVLPEVAAKETASPPGGGAKSGGGSRLMRRLFKWLLAPLWNPIRWRFYAPLKRIEAGVAELQGQRLQTELLAQEIGQIKRDLERQRELLLQIAEALRERQ